MKADESIKKRFSWETRNETQNVAPDITQVYIELSTFCNLACSTCARNSMHELRHVHLSEALAKKIVSMLLRLASLKRIVLFGFGEALCNPSFVKILTILRPIQCEIILVTNALLLDDEVVSFLAELPVNKIFISCDDDFSGLREEIIRKGSKATVLFTNIRKLVSVVESKPGTNVTIGMEVVATKQNAGKLNRIMDVGEKLGVHEFIVTNIFPYSEAVKNDYLYNVFEPPEDNISTLLKKYSKSNICHFADQSADVNRMCPFIEKGTIFISAEGNISPCPELAYSHNAYYFGNRRYHQRVVFGSVCEKDIESIWHSESFSVFRNTFRYWDYPDCTTCVDPDKCWHRTVEQKDCYGNNTPCGECLWAKNIVVCP